MTTPGQASMLWFSGAGPDVWPLSFSGAQDYTVTADAVPLDCSIDDPLLVPSHLQNTPDGDKFNLRGRIYSAVFEPFCYISGYFTPNATYNELYEGEN